MNRFSNLLGGIADGVRAARLRAEFDRMNDRQLADIGLTRGDVPRKASEWTARH